jgi:hypothetical protein
MRRSIRVGLYRWQHIRQHLGDLFGLLWGGTREWHVVKRLGLGDCEGEGEGERVLLQFGRDKGCLLVLVKG